jgi:ubiquinone/menaquinone biosynthesis C-methylase UbiE
MPDFPVAHESAPGFDTLADVYDRFRIGYAPELYEALDDYGLPAAGSVLDLACGTGLVSRELAARGLRVTGVDISESMLERARDRARAATFVRADAEALPFDGTTFDAAVSAQSFHWFDRSKALAELERVVKPGGTIAIWWKELLRGDGIRLVREEVSRSLGIADPKPLLGEHFDAFAESDLVDQRLRVIPWIVPMRASDYVGYERSRMRARETYGALLEEYLSLLAARLGPPESTLTLSYLHLLYLGRVPERAS